MVVLSYQLDGETDGKEGIEPPARLPTGDGGEDKKEGPLPYPLRRKAAALNRLNWTPVRLMVGHLVYSGGDLRSNRRPGTDF